MLVLSRKVNQKIIVGDNEIVFTIVGIQGNKVRVGIDAPDDVIVHREEVFRTADPKKGTSEKAAETSEKAAETVPAAGSKS